ncbi:hypothetical protein SPNA45_02037 [Streptococcus pneumoniae SPNA45]|nr:hypothetical protein SPNA45_02037 [Streptococcus pneumoniae SPNA45]
MIHSKMFVKSIRLRKKRVWDKKILILGILYYKFLKSID